MSTAAGCDFAGWRTLTETNGVKRYLASSPFSHTSLSTYPDTGARMNVQWTSSLQGFTITASASEPNVDRHVWARGDGEREREREREIQRSRTLR